MNAPHLTSHNDNEFEQASDAKPGPAVITIPYLLVINVPLYVDEKGALFAERLWFKDLALHLSYIRDFTLACPIETPPPQNAIPLADDSRFAGIAVVPLPAPASLTHAILLLPLTLRRLFRAISKAKLVHCGVAGWPIPLGWLATPLASLLHRRTLIIVESAPWRLQRGLPASFTGKIKARMYERLAKWCMRSTDLAIYTQEEYRRSLPSRPGSGYVIHASWIDEDIIISDNDAEHIWEQKLLEAPGRELRILFAGRLDAEKGVHVLLKAITLLSPKSAALRLDILGTGKLLPDCKVVSDALNGATRVQLLGTVAYGAPLFQLLRDYHVLVVPSISDEQPRIVYDSYSQAVPVIAASTSGLRDCVKEGETGWLVRPGDAADLAGALERAIESRDELRSMGVRAAAAARAMTHQCMHEKRQRLLSRLLEEQRMPASRGPG